MYMCICNYMLCISIYTYTYRYMYTYTTTGNITYLALACWKGPRNSDDE